MADCNRQIEKGKNNSPRYCQRK